MTTDSRLLSAYQTNRISELERSEKDECALFGFPSPNKLTITHVFPITNTPSNTKSPAIDSFRGFATARLPLFHESLPDLLTLDTFTILSSKVLNTAALSLLVSIIIVQPRARETVLHNKMILETMAQQSARVCHTGAGKNRRAT